MFNTFLTPEQVAAVLPSFNAMHPLGRNGRPADAAEACTPAFAAEYGAEGVAPIAWRPHMEPAKIRYRRSASLIIFGALPAP